MTISIVSVVPAASGAAGAGVVLSDAALDAAGRRLIAAAAVVQRAPAEPPERPLPSLTGIGDEVAEHLRGVSVARAALADAGRTACAAVAALMRESGELDASIASALPGGFALASDDA